MIMAMIEIYRVTGNKKYLNCARTAMELYEKRDIDNFSFTAGAIDCACIDKETAYPFIRSALDLYEITGEEQYLVYAQKSAYYFHRTSCEERGHLNDMYVGWPSAFRLDTILRIEEELGGDFSIIEKK